MNDEVNHPSHYTRISGVECIQVTENMNFNVGNAMKYLWRAGFKKYQEKSASECLLTDLEKAVWYINREIERVKAAK